MLCDSSWFYACKLYSWIRPLLLFISLIHAPNVNHKWNSYKFIINYFNIHGENSGWVVPSGVHIIIYIYWWLILMTFISLHTHTQTHIRIRYDFCSSDGVCLVVRQKAFCGFAVGVVARVIGNFSQHDDSTSSLLQTSIKNLTMFLILLYCVNLSNFR